MNNSNGIRRRRRRQTSLSRRAELLAAFGRSGLSAAAFARQQGLPYTTFCAWRHRQAPAKPCPAFVEVEVAEPVAGVELMIEVGSQARLRIRSAAELELAARFLRRLNALASC